ncbi:hypothetical protein TNCV_4262721 [Trichonephila clavipes]|nr:hypothetical protein TNCV_4262721 [Trichonephila clavipes]
MLFRSDAHFWCEVVLAQSTYLAEREKNGDRDARPRGLPIVTHFNVVTPNRIGVLGGPNTHTCILQLQRNPFLTPEELNPVDRKMKERDALNLLGSGGQSIPPLTKYWTLTIFN